MTKRIIRHSLSIIFLSMILALVPVALDFSSTNHAQAMSWLDKAKTGGLDQVGQAYNSGVPQDARKTVVDLIKLFLGFLGLLAVILILWAGFKWMTAGGNEETVGEAKKILTAGLIGLVIILSAYIIANFVIAQIYGVTTGTQVINY